MEILLETAASGGSNARAASAEHESGASRGGALTQRLWDFSRRRDNRC